MTQEVEVTAADTEVVPAIAFGIFGGVFLNPCEVIVDGDKCGLPFQDASGWLLDHHNHTYHPFPVRNVPTPKGYYRRVEIVESELSEAY